MSVPEVVGLALYALQQLGIALGVGGETVLLLSGASNPMLAGAARRITRIALWLIILSGILITSAHVIAGEGATVGEPAYLFKWLLIILILGAGFMARGSVNTVIVGGTWFALFFLHTLAPVAPWLGLVIIYAGWMALFALVFLLLHSFSGVREAPPAEAHSEEYVPEVPLPAPETSRQAGAPRPPASPKASQGTAPPLSFEALAKKEPPPPPRPSPAPAPAPLSMPAMSTQAHASFMAVSEPPPPQAPFRMPLPNFSWKSSPPPPASPKASQGTAPPLSFESLAKKEPPVPRPGMTTMPSAPPPNLPGVPVESGLAPIALQSIPTATPEQNAKPLSGIRVMPRSPSDLNK